MSLQRDVIGWPGTLSPTASRDLLSRVMLEQLFLGTEDPRHWRLRYSSRITPLTPASYREAVAYQFRLPRTLLEAAVAKRGGVLDDKVSSVEIVFPIDYLPKQLLLDLALRGPDGKETHLLHSEETTAWMTGIFRTAMEAIDTWHAVAERPGVAQRFREQNERIIDCLIGSGQGEIARRLERIRPFSPVCPRRHEFVSGILAQIEDGVRQFTGEPHLSRLLRIDCEVAAEVAFGVFEDRHYRHLDDAQFHSPILNPLLLIVDYLKRYAITDDPSRAIERFLLDSYEFQRRLLDIRHERVWPYVMTVLSQFTYFYVAMSRLKVPLDRDFTIELNHVIPLGEPAPLRGQRLAAGWRRIRYTGYQWYPFRLGDYRSIHIEVASETPAELQQRPRKALIDVGDAYVPAALLFGRASHTAPDHCHFYTNKTAAEISRTLRALALAKKPSPPKLARMVDDSLSNPTLDGTVASTTSDRLVVVSSEEGTPAEGRTFLIASDSLIEKRGRPIGAGDIMIGDSVRVIYREEAESLIALSISVDDRGLMHDFRLGVRYEIEVSTRWGYRFISAVALFASVFLVSVYDPETRGRGNFLPVVPLLFTFGGVLASFRAQEAIVAARVRKYKLTVLVLSFAMATYFLLGVLHPPLVSGVRRVLDGVGLGSVLTRAEAPSVWIS